MIRFMKLKKLKFKILTIQWRSIALINNKDKRLKVYNNKSDN